MEEEPRPGEQNEGFVAPRTGEQELPTTPELSETHGLNELVEQLGFVEDEATKALRQALIAQMQTKPVNRDAEKQAYDAWREAAEERDKTDETHYGLILSQMLIFKEAGLADVYREEVEHTLESLQEAPDTETLVRVKKALEAERNTEKEVVLTIEHLPGMVGFIETPAMFELRGQFTEAIASNSDETRIALAKQYTALANEVVGQFQGDELDRAEIGRIVAMAMIRRDAGRTDYYLEELDEALTRSEQEGYDDLAEIIRAELDSAAKNSPAE